MNSWYLPEWMKGLGTRQFQVVACSRENPAKAKWVWAIIVLNVKIVKTFGYSKSIVYTRKGQIVCFCSKHKLLMFAANRLQLVCKQWCSVHEFCWWNQLLPIFNWNYNKTSTRTKTHKYCYMTQLMQISYLRATFGKRGQNPNNKIWDVLHSKVRTPQHTLSSRDKASKRSLATCACSPVPFPPYHTSRSARDRRSHVHVLALYFKQLLQS
jgi:hypothetical protein